MVQRLCGEPDEAQPAVRWQREPSATPSQRASAAGDGCTELTAPSRVNNYVREVRSLASYALATAALLTAASCLLIDDYSNDYTLEGSNPTGSSQSSGAGGATTATGGGGSAGGAGEGGSCMLVDPGAVTKTCNANNNCPKTIDCPSSEGACHVVCNNNACKDKVVNCPTGHPCQVTCQGNNACEKIRVNCLQASSCKIICGEAKSCGAEANIYCGDGACGADCEGDVINVHCDDACECLNADCAPPI